MNLAQPHPSLIELTQKVMQSTYLMSLATVADNYPWVADVVFVHDDQLNLYWISKPDALHSQNIAACPNVAATITQSTNQGEDNICLQIAGTAAVTSGSMALVTKHLRKRRKLTAESAQNFIKKDAAWYKLSPTRIELIYEPLFGHDRQSVDLAKLNLEIQHR